MKLTDAVKGAADRVLEDLVHELEETGQELSQELRGRVHALAVDATQVAMLGAMGDAADPELPELRKLLKARTQSLEAAASIELVRAFSESFRRVVAGAFEVVLAALSVV